MEIENNIVLRPRFQKDIALTTETILENAKKLKEEVKEDYRIKISDNHIFFFITLAKRKYYSPHLHIELEENEDKTTHIKGLFGPDQTVWTFFMFLHFIIAGIFLIFSMIAYSHWRLKQSTTLDFIIMGTMVVFWFALYTQARINRKKCAPQMYKLEDLMNKILE
ncbi:hypothetical protein [Flavobacterium sp. N2270]|uniref:hypothetical protein n=1 Tax=Flavobacterium sp. N2270 TaxID=2986831 RepID=UPI0022247676|nr:hypothetical protein [Flavobacterium sp. N2270]